MAISSIQFLVDRLDGYEDLRVLVWLHRHAREAWTSSALAARLDITPESMDEALENLVREGLVEQLGLAFRYRCDDKEIDAVVRVLVETYEEDCARVASLMVDNAVRRLRTATNLMLASTLGLPKSKHAD